MKSIGTLRRYWAAGGLVAALVFALGAALVPAVALAEEPDPRAPVALTVAAPADVPLGNLARIVAELRDGGGQPVAKAKIVFTSPATLGGVVGEMALGEVSTDAQGVATLDYQLRIQGQNQFIARFHGDETRQPAEARTLIVATGQKQLVERPIGLQVPFVGPWVLIAVLGGVWSVYFASLLLVAGIPEGPKRQPSFETGGER